MQGACGIILVVDHPDRSVSLSFTLFLINRLLFPFIFSLRNKFRSAVSILHLIPRIFLLSFILNMPVAYVDL